MAALWNRAGHYIFALWFLSFFLSSFFSSPNLSGRRLDVYHTSTQWCGLSANSKCRSEMCCTRLAGNAGHKKSSKICRLGTIAQLRWAISSQLRHVSRTRKELVKQQYLHHMFSQYGELLLTGGWDRFVSLGHPANFNGFLHLGSITARYLSSGRQPNFAALNRGRHLYSTGRPSRWALAHIVVGEVLLHVWCPSSLSTNSVKALKETQSTDSKSPAGPSNHALNPHPHLIHQQTAEGTMSCHLRQLSDLIHLRFDRQWHRALWDCGNDRGHCGIVAVTQGIVGLWQWHRALWDCGSDRGHCGIVTMTQGIVGLWQWHRALWDCYCLLQLSSVCVVTFQLNALNSIQCALVALHCYYFTVLFSALQFVHFHCIWCIWQTDTRLTASFSRTTW